MKLYVMRHGQTDWNVAGKVQGCTDIELNKNGVKQAQKAREKFNQCDIDVILCSPLKRTKKTAEIVNQDKQVPVIFEERLKERNFGDLEGKYPEKYRQKFINAWNYLLNAKEDNIEPVVNLCDKVWGFLDEVKEKYQDKNVMLVTHGAISHVILAYFEGISEDGSLRMSGMENCEIREFEWDKGEKDGRFKRITKASISK